MQSFKVFSADWEIIVKSNSYEEAAIAGTLSKMKELGELFMVAPIVVTVNKKTGKVEFSETAAILEDLQMYPTARVLREYIKSNNL